MTPPESADLPSADLPHSEHPTGRPVVSTLAMGLSVALAAAPLLWWWPITWPAPRLWLVLAALAVALCVRRVRSGRQRAAREGGPTGRLSRAEGLSLALVLPTLWFTHPLWDPRTTPADLIDRFLHAFDWVGHFEMANHALAAGVILPRAAEGPLGPWFYGHYPAGFHAGVATVMEALGAHPGQATANIPAFGAGTAVVLTAGYLAMVSAALSLPWVRANPWMGPVISLSFLAVVFLGQASMPVLLLGGYPNFVLAWLMVATGILAALAWDGRDWAPLITVVAAVVGSAHNWPLLSPLVGVPLLAVLWRRRSGPLVSTGRGRLALLTLVGTVGSVSALAQLGVGSSHLVVTGEFSSTSLWPPVIGVTTAILVVTATARAHTLTAFSHAADVVLLAAAVSALLVSGAVMGYQLVQSGTLSYYAWKLLVAVQMVATVLVVVLAPMLVRQRGVVPRTAAAIAALLVLASAMRVWLPRVPGEGLSGPRARSIFAESTFQRPRTMDIIGAAEAVPSGSGEPVLFVRPRLAEDRDQAQQASWVFALTFGWSARADRLKWEALKVMPTHGPRRHLTRDELLTELQRLMPGGTVVISERTDPRTLVPQPITVLRLRAYP